MAETKKSTAKKIEAKEPVKKASTKKEETKETTKKAPAKKAETKETTKKASAKKATTVSTKKVTSKKTPVKKVDETLAARKPDLRWVASDVYPRQVVDGASKASEHRQEYNHCGRRHGYGNQAHECNDVDHRV